MATERIEVLHRGFFGIKSENRTERWAGWGAILGGLYKGITLLPLISLPEYTFAYWAIRVLAGAIVGAGLGWVGAKIVNKMVRKQ